MKNLLFILSSLFIIFTISCSDSSTKNCSELSYSQEFQTEIQNITDAATAYGTDPTTANCNNYKNAYIAYIDALEEWEDCAIEAGSEAEWRQSLDEARLSIDSIVC